jgi:HSP20 family protein
MMENRRRQRQHQRQRQPANLAAWRPVMALDEVERMMNDWPMSWRRTPEEDLVWMPAMELYEKEDQYVIRMELPGIKPEDVGITVSGDTLTVKGERKPSSNVSEDEYQMCETCYGSFSRSVTLP